MTVDNAEDRPRSNSERAAQERALWLAGLRAAPGAYGDGPAECFQCGRIYPRGELVAVEEIPGYRWPRYCPACAEEIRATHERCCALCGTLYLAATAAGRGDATGGSDPPRSWDATGLCPACSSGERLREWTRVRYHLLRAARLGLPATLTLGQWLSTVEHFGGGCAYCGAQPFTDLDHFIPLAAGGGTTATNCVPACGRCNNLKRAMDPGRPPWAQLPRAVLERVDDYLHSGGTQAV